MTNPPIGVSGHTPPGAGKRNSIDADSWRQMSARSWEIYVQAEREVCLKKRNGVENILRGARLPQRRAASSSLKLLASPTHVCLL